MGTVLGRSVLFNHFLKHLFSPIVGMSEGLIWAPHIRKSVPRELFLVAYIKLQMARREKWDPERMKTAIEAMKNGEMGSYKASRVFILPQTTLQRYVKDRQKSSIEAVKQNWVGSSSLCSRK